MVMIFLCSCSYTDPRSYVKIENASAKPSSHILAISASHWIQREPTGFINTLPNGGIPKVISKVGKIYILDADKDSIELKETTNLFHNNKEFTTAWIDGWSDDDLHFSLRGSDEHSNFFSKYYKLKNGRQLEIINEQPQLKNAKNSGPPAPPPFLRYSKGHNDIEIGIDSQHIKNSKKIIKVHFEIKNNQVQPILEIK